MRPLTGIVVAGAIACPWFIWAAVRDPEMLRTFFAKFNYRPFTEPILGHSGPFWYYVPVILIGFYPWSAFLGQSAVALVRRLRARDRWTAGHILLACWFGVFLVFWSICRTKLPHYLLPTYPALALLTACFLHNLIAHPEQINRRWLRLDLSTTMLAGAGLVVGFPIVAAFFVPGEWWLGSVGFILLVGAGYALWLFSRNQNRRAVAAFAVMSVAWITAIFGFAAIRIDRYQFSKPLAADIQQHASGPRQIAGYRFIRESLVFYTGQSIVECRSVEDLKAFLSKATDPYVITVDEHVEDIEAHFPGQFRELVRRPRFLHPGEVVVLARQFGSHIPLTADRISSRRK
jgi:4-amino-4-deoxy-L-arabinose transferase-like glycosyltransferase